MAQRNSSGRGATATRTKRQAGNQSPNTPGVSESEISRMRVADIRGQLRRRGVSGISALRKPELVKTLARTLRSEGRQGGAARKATGPAGRASATRKTTGTAKRTSAARKKAAPAPTRAKATTSRAKAAPSRAKSTPSRAKATPSKAKAAPSKAKATPSRAKAAPSRAKAAPSKAKAAPSKAAAPSRARTAPVRATATPPPAAAAPSRVELAQPAQQPSTTVGSAALTTAPTRTGVRTGRLTARSASSSQQITSVADQPERPGRSLVTANHEVIQRWARARSARPATIAGTEREGRPGVLTFNIPGYRESSRIREISWDDWFRTFDARRLNLIYQEQLRDGRQSNFFRTESPDRADA